MRSDRIGNASIIQNLCVQLITATPVNVFVRGSGNQIVSSLRSLKSSNKMILWFATYFLKQEMLQ